MATKAPGVTITHFDPELRRGGRWRVAWRDRNNDGVSGQVEIVDDSVHVEMTNAVGSDRSARVRLVRIVDGLDPPSPPPPPAPPVPTPPAVRTWRGNFLANGFEPWAFMYPGWDADRRTRFRRRYRAEGWTHLPIGIWGAYGHEPAFDYRANVDGYRDLLRELLADGLIPCVFVVTDQLPGDPAWSAQQGIDFAARYCLQVADLVPAWCLGWELNQVAGWDESGNPQQGHDMIRLGQTIKSAGYGAPVYAHFQPNWWGPHYADGDEAQWWRDVGGSIDGLLFQIRPESSRSLSGDSQAPDGVYLALRYPRGSDGALGICGRLQAMGKEFVLFEHARTRERWEQTLAAITRDGDRVQGWC